MSLHHPHHELTMTSSTSQQASTSNRAPEPTVNPQNQKIKSRAHLGITIRGGRRPPAGRAVLRAVEIVTPPLVWILVGWLGC